MKQQEIKQTMANIYTKVAEENGKDTAISDITYYKQFTFDFANFTEKDIFITRLEKIADKKQKESYELYGKSGELLAIIDEKGKIKFAPEYIEKLKEEYKEYFKILNLENAKLPAEASKEEEKDNSVSYTPEDLKKEIEKEEKQKEKEKSSQEIAKQKGIPVNNVLIVRNNSNLYKDHPELEKNLIFYRDNDGIVRAEYSDENGDLQPSKYIQPSSTNMRQQTVSIGNDGEPVTKETPQQVMKTQGLTGKDKDIRDIRFNIKLDSYGYIEIEEARQGRNGEWAAHEIEVKGRKYNSPKVNEQTSIRTGVADPDKETENYNSMQEIEEPQEEVQYDQMYLIQHSEEIIEGFVKEGYQRGEAVDIFNYMIGEQALTEEQAKEQVNDEIKEKEELEKEIEQDEEKTPWGDAEAREARKRL